MKKKSKWKKWKKENNRRNQSFFIFFFCFYWYVYFFLSPASLMFRIWLPTGALISKISREHVEKRKGKKAAENANWFTNCVKRKREM